MPKKHRPSSLNTKPLSTAPSSLRTLSGDLAGRPDQDVPSVNDLLHRLRLDQRQCDAPSKTPLSVSGSKHPSLKLILNISEMPVPQLRHGPRHVSGPSRTRRIPGPPPPKSWLTSSAHAPKEDWPAESYRRVQEQTCKLPGAQFPPPNSLRHHVLKAMASSWKWHVEYDHIHLAYLPTAMKEILLSYVSLFDDNTIDSLEVLFPSAIDGEIDDFKEVTRLDLSNRICSLLTITDIRRRLNQRPPKQDATQLEQTNEVPDSWDAVEDAAVPGTMIPLQMTAALCFSNLRHLSLALRPELSRSAFASWSQLLKLVPNLATLASLSLAYWPVPTYTPRAATTRLVLKNPVSSSIPGTSYGGTNMYSIFDEDWRESAGIIRTLSRYLYCLRWLDLTGCGEWFEALVWDSKTGDGKLGAPASVSVIWNGNWRDVEYIGLGVGWTPSGGLPIDKSTQLQNDQASRVDSHYGFPDGRTAEMLTRLRTTGSRPEPSSTANPHHAMETWDVDEEREKYRKRKEVEEYMDIWNTARRVAKKLRDLRSGPRSKRLHFDFGDGQAE